MYRSLCLAATLCSLLVLGMNFGCDSDHPNKVEPLPVSVTMQLELNPGIEQLLLKKREEVKSSPAAQQQVSEQIEVTVKTSTGTLFQEEFTWGELIAMSIPAEDINISAFFQGVNLMPLMSIGLIADNQTMTEIIDPSSFSSDGSLNLSFDSDEIEGVRIVFPGINFSNSVYLLHLEVTTPSELNDEVWFKHDNQLIKLQNQGSTHFERVFPMVISEEISISGTLVNNQEIQYTDTPGSFTLKNLGFLFYGSENYEITPISGGINTIIGSDLNELKFNLDPTTGIKIEGTSGNTLSKTKTLIQLPITDPTNVSNLNLPEVAENSLNLISGEYLRVIREGAQLKLTLWNNAYPQIGTEATPQLYLSYAEDGLEKVIDGSFLDSQQNFIQFTLEEAYEEGRTFFFSCQINDLSGGWLPILSNQAPYQDYSNITSLGEEIYIVQENGSNVFTSLQ